MIPEREREALMRLTMCARGECMMCIYQPKDDRCKDIATRSMHILADALEQADTPQTERPSDDDETIQAIYHLQKVGWLQEHDRILTDTPQTEDLLITEYPQKGEVNIVGNGSNIAVVMDYDEYKAMQTESTGSPIGDYRDGVGAWQTDCSWK